MTDRNRWFELGNVPVEVDGRIVSVHPAPDKIMVTSQRIRPATTPGEKSSITVLMNRDDTRQHIANLVRAAMAVWPDFTLEEIV